MSRSDDETHMRRAIEIARAHVGLTGDNPSVGCVIVSGGAVVGEGVTGAGGRPHAEEVALDFAGDGARGGTAYVTLEPCAERSSGAHSCSQRLAEAGISRVVVACADSSVFAAGRGAHRLQAAGIVTDQGLLSAEADELYSSYHPAKSGEIRR
jgi:diaminohydroxyphosphoribosylaminopyrimidine deaminase/5-amino-6-(5-phosphoribosylamino)uracil reductase